ncbi:MAG: hypothetical protein ACRDQT_04645 [Gaiellaceae bacterium]
MQTAALYRRSPARPPLSFCLAPPYMLDDVLDDDGNLVGHMFLGEDGRPFFEPLAVDEPD